MGFLNRVSAAKGDIYIALDDIYESDSQYKEFVGYTVDLLYKFAIKFKINDDKMLDIFSKHLKKEV